MHNTPTAAHPDAQQQTSYATAHNTTDSNMASTTASKQTLASSKSWTNACKAFWDKKVAIMLLLGFSAGIPILLIFSSLSLWLGEAGIDRKHVTMFSWAALGYSFKFVWAPLIDSVPLPLLKNWLGRRRSWLLVAQLAVIGAIVWMGLTDPTATSTSLYWMAAGAVLLGFASATQDIVIDAFRIEFADPKMQAVLSAAYTTGYRLAMIVSGAGALFLADYLGTSKENYNYLAWQTTYLAMAGVMLVGVITTLCIKEPALNHTPKQWLSHDYGRMIVLFGLCIFAFIQSFIHLHDLLPLADNTAPLWSFLYEAGVFISCIAITLVAGYLMVNVGVVKKSMAVEIWINPIVDFFRRFGWKTAASLLLFIGFYRISDIVAGVISNLFYQDMGFSKTEIATAVKTIGVAITIVGGIVGALLVQRYSIYKILMLGAFVSSVSHLSCVGLAYAGRDFSWLYFAVFADNFASGIASAAFIAFLAGLTNTKFTASQYAIFSSLMTLLPKVIGGYSGGMVTAIGYPLFFVFTSAIGLPVLLLVLLIQRRMRLIDQA